MNFGAEVPFLRKKISKDNSNDSGWIFLLINYLISKENYYPDLIIHLRPTSPNRELKFLKRKNGLRNKSSSTSVRSVSIFSQPPQLFKIRKKFLTGFFNDKYNGEYHSDLDRVTPKLICLTDI